MNFWPIAIPAGLGALGYATMAPRSCLWGRVIARGDAADPPRYALTFDDGPTDGATDRALDILSELNVKAAFFVIGINAQRSPKLIERIHNEGHIVANHSFDHSHFGGLRLGGYWRDQLARTDAVIANLIGVRPALFRPPMGVKTWRIISAARGTRHHVITWTRRAIDGIRPNSARIINRLVPHTRAGDILILHDGVEPHSRRDPVETIKTIKPLITQLRARGLEPARLDELIHLPAYQSAI